MNAKTCLLLLLAGMSGAPTVVVANDTVLLPLTASRANAGEIAQASLSAYGQQTSLVITVGGVPATVSQPVHLYTYLYPGSCAQPGAKPAFALNEVVLPRQQTRLGPWILSKQIPLPLNELRARNYALVLRTAPADGNQTIFCGVLG
ncbi:hypothetical protein JQX08_19415 [Pseudomonas sp. UL073]|uniref:Uncharacterized protein n=1 Tax=Zestomonas insulae TaxID=2809017 RepID=A0ABS2IIK0_9GAMM|nr:hypothetical protein [Pseudomonas insulae]MBM7062890.1 hypothetical protein [Pseudomonas insulae]